MLSNRILYFLLQTLWSKVGFVVVGLGQLPLNNLAPPHACLTLHISCYFKLRFCLLFYFSRLPKTCQQSKMIKKSVFSYKGRLKSPFTTDFGFSSWQCGLFSNLHNSAHRKLVMLFKTILFDVDCFDRIR